MSIAGFYKDIDDPIYTSIQTGVNGTFSGIAVPNATVTRPVNARKERIYGIEGNIQAQLTFLPAPFDGFGVGLNYAYIDGDTSGIPGRTGDAPPFFQSKHVGTAQLFYEKGRVAARVAYSYRSHYLEGIGADPSLDTYVADHGQLDVRGSFALLPQVTVFAEGSNLTDASATPLSGAIVAGDRERALQLFGARRHPVGILIEGDRPARYYGQGDQAGTTIFASGGARHGPIRSCRAKSRRTEGSG